jgi:hypothetical protein
VNAKTNANLNANNPVISAAIIRVAPLFAGEVLVFWFDHDAPKNQRNWFKGRITAYGNARSHKRRRKGLRNRAQAFQPGQSH